MLCEGEELRLRMPGSDSSAACAVVAILLLVIHTHKILECYVNRELVDVMGRRFLLEREDFNP